MLRKQDLVLIVKTGHNSGVREVGHFDQGMGLVGPRKMSYKAIEPKKTGKGSPKQGTIVRMSKIQGKMDANTGRMEYTKRVSR